MFTRARFIFLPKMYINNIIYYLLFGFLLFCIASFAKAGSKPDNITDVEMSLLPSYCLDTEAYKHGPRGSVNQSPRAIKWERMLGHGFWSLHHACWAKIYVIRSYRSGVSIETRKNMRENAVLEYLYVINNTPEDFILLPEIYTRIGELNILLGRFKAANDSFFRARELKKDYWPAYSNWADYLIRSGQKNEAKRLLKEGLEYSPNAKVLINLYRSVGGDLAEIIPNSEELQDEKINIVGEKN